MTTTTDVPRFSPRSVSCAALLLLAALPAGAQMASSNDGSQRGNSADSAALNEVIVTGTRTKDTRAVDSVSPIDIISGDALRSTGQADLRDSLVSTVPSITREMADGNTGVSGFTDMIRLRGLNPDDTLVLVDGKRRHGTADLYLHPGPQEGATAPDIDLIPSSMIDHIEILRDGAAAQYGSDAVAGVINIITKKNAQGGSLQTTNGLNEHGDGFKDDTTGQVGFNLGSDGFLNLAGEFMHMNPTVRSGVDTRTNEFDNKVFGTNEVTRESLGLNFAKPLNEALTLYGNATLAHRHAQSYENFRLASVLPSYYPGGFTPIETADENDYALTLGLRRDDLFGFGWDLSSTFGHDRMKLGIIDTANLSYYADFGSTPTSAYVGTLDSKQLTNNFDITRNFSLPSVTDPLHFAAGLEHRKDFYQIIPGELASYYGQGTQAEVGYSPLAATDNTRNVYAGYLDFEQRFFQKLDIDIAGRYEHYTDAGNTETGKFSARYQFIPEFALRATVSNGFRAPTLAEEYYSHLGTSPTSAQGQIAVNSQAAILLGAVPLRPETSTNYSVGFVAEPLSRLTIQVDAYQIAIHHRIIDGDAYTGIQAVNALEMSGIQLAPTNIVAQTSVQYFSNGASTRTRGVDLTSSYATNLGDYGHIDWSLGVDYNQTDLTSLDNDTNGKPLLSAQGASYITTASPKSKVILGAHYTLGGLSATLRETRYGSTEQLLTYYTGPNANSHSVFYPQVNEARYLTDIDVSYQLPHGFQVALGALNVFNIKPTEVPLFARYLGAAIYNETVSQVGPNGGFYYARLNYSF